MRYKIISIGPRFHDSRPRDVIANLHFHLEPALAALIRPHNITKLVNRKDGTGSDLRRASRGKSSNPMSLEDASKHVRVRVRQLRQQHECTNIESNRGAFIMAVARLQYCYVCSVGGTHMNASLKVLRTWHCTPAQRVRRQLQLLRQNTDMK